MMNWIQTHSGRRFFVLDPQPEHVDLHDIAHALSLQCRFNGQCREFYSVAEHCVRVSHLLPADPPELALPLWGLLHDAAEAYVSDLPRPVKAQLPLFAEMEDRVLQAVALRFGLPWPAPDAVWSADDVLLMTEARDLMAPPPEPWSIVADPLPEVIRPLGPREAKIAFLERYEQLASLAARVGR
jgi:hypothetical protein